ncbi:hypothetical protein ACIQMV_36025 [Streptomyces sp. NPDC091412]|uniref:hypothetical protein n=1 Tax=Streptomyces sp. NPDC091412 TaxID=3366002 RepID=UPI003820B7C8
MIKLRDPAQRARLADIRDDLIARVAEAEREGWLGEVEGLPVRPRRRPGQARAARRRGGTPIQWVNLGLPTFGQIGLGYGARPR